jgi:hypothetical protein
VRSGGSNAREKKAVRPPMVTRDTGELNEDLESEFVRIGKPWLCTATKGHALGRSSWSGNLRRRHARYPQFSTSDRQEAARFQSTSETRNDILDSRNNPVNRSAREGK